MPVITPWAVFDDSLSYISERENLSICDNLIQTVIIYYKLNLMEIKRIRIDNLPHIGM